MPNCQPFTDSATLQADLQQLAAESLGWQPLGEGAYLHHGSKNNPEGEIVLHIVGVPDVSFAGLNVLLLT